MEFNSVGWHVHRTQEITDCDRWCGLEEVDLRHKGFWHYTPNIRLLGITGEPQRNKEVPIWSKINEIWMIHILGIGTHKWIGTCASRQMGWWLGLKGHSAVSEWLIIGLKIFVFPNIGHFALFACWSLLRIDMMRSIGGRRPSVSLMWCLSKRNLDSI